MATGFAVCGIVFAIAAFMSVGGVISAGREGRDGRAFFTSLVGGLLALAATGCVAAARDHGHDLDGDRLELTGTLGHPLPARAPIV